MASRSKTAKGETAKEKTSTTNGISSSFTRSGKVVGIGVSKKNLEKCKSTGRISSANYPALKAAFYSKIAGKIAGMRNSIRFSRRLNMKRARSASSALKVMIQRDKTHITRRISRYE